MRELIVYQCEYCPKYYKHKRNTKSHEKICFHNPETKSCASCGNFYNWKDHIDDDHGEPQEVKEYYCDHFDKEFVNRGDGKLNLQTQCEYWKEKDNA